MPAWTQTPSNHKQLPARRHNCACSCKGTGRNNRAGASGRSYNLERNIEFQGRGMAKLQHVFLIFKERVGRVLGNMAVTFISFTGNLSLCLRICMSWTVQMCKYKPVHVLVSHSWNCLTERCHLCLFHVLVNFSFLDKPRKQASKSMCMSVQVNTLAGGMRNNYGHCCSFVCVCITVMLLQPSFTWSCDHSSHVCSQ